jgi:phosphopantothenoylcysteine decarboxylase/phosphopantothenate--cysteine ligase
MKIERTESLSLNLKMNPDILLATSTLEKRPFTVGFSAETGDRIDRARKKLSSKKTDMIVFNDVSKRDAGFDVDTNEVTVLDAEGEKALPLMTKGEVASAIFDRIVELRKR